MKLKLESFETELFSQNLAFVVYKGVRRGHVIRIPTNPPETRWVGKMGGRKYELEIQGTDLHDLRATKKLYELAKYNEERKDKLEANYPK